MNTPRYYYVNGIGVTAAEYAEYVGPVLDDFQRRLAAVEAVAVDMDRRANHRSSAYIRAKDVANAIRHALENQ